MPRLKAKRAPKAKAPVRKRVPKKVASRIRYLREQGFEVIADEITESYRGN